MTQSKARKQSARPVSKSLQEYARGVAGGLLFSLPLLYTMEVWWAGFTAHPARLLLYVLVIFALLLGYNFYAGLRRDASWIEVAIDSVEEMGLGLVVSALMLFLLGRLTSDMTGSEIMGKIVIEAMTVAIGVSVGSAQLGGSGDDSGTDAGTAGSGNVVARRGDKSGDGVHFGGQLVMAFCGAVLFASNVAPTEEIVLIAIENSTWKILGLVLVSLALSALILYYSDFSGAESYAPAQGIHSVVIGTVITYGVALASAALMLWFFDRFGGQTFAVCIAQTVVLGVAATLGASAGRLLLQSR